MANQPKKTAIAGSARFEIPGAKRTGKSDPAQIIKVSIYARRNPGPPVEALSKIEKLSTALPAEREYLTDDEFNRVYGADPKDLTAIETWAAQNNLRVLEKNISQKRILVEGSIQDICAAFDIELYEYEHPDLGHYRGRTGKLYIPQELYGIIEGVFGLDTRPIGHSRRRRGPGPLIPWKDFTAREEGGKKITLTAPANQWPGTFFPIQLAELYSYPQSFDGTGQNIAIFAFNGTGPDPQGGYSLSALQNYFGNVLGQTTPAITDVVIQGPGNDPGPDTEASSNNGDSTGEVMLDMCVVGSVAPGAKIFMYFTEFTSQGWVDAIQNAVAGSNSLSVVSISYGNPESDPNSAWTSMGVNVVNQAFEASVAKGITICCASGDDGSSDGATKGSEVDFPASSPYVLGVGGTKLVASANMQTIVSETVWNEMLQQEGATGGGISAIFSKPAYQNSVNVPPTANPPHRIGRGVPDVAADADPTTGVVVMHIDGENLEPIGGTSAATPLWASLIVRLNQALNAPCGFINTVLYAKCATNVLNDITVGNNGAYNAGPGWDACTGLGTPDGEKLLDALK